MNLPAGVPPEVFPKLAIIGTGLMGGSLAMAARENGLCNEVLGVDTSTEAAETARTLGIIDRQCSLEEAADADCVVVATPPATVESIISVLARTCKAGTLIMDLASIKEPLLEGIDEICPLSLHFISVHPMAGRELSGPGAAQADLFKNAPLFLVPSVSTRPEAIERAEAFWRHLGARVYQALPAEHDAIVTGVSHIPQLVAFALAAALAELYPNLQEISQYAGHGLKGMIRTARSDADLWTQILALNQENTRAALKPFLQKLQAFQDAIEAAGGGDTEMLEELIRDSNRAGHALSGDGQR